MSDSDLSISDNSSDDAVSRRGSLAISALLNEEPVEPSPYLSPTPSSSEKREYRKTWPGFFVPDESPVPSHMRSPSMAASGQQVNETSSSGHTIQPFTNDVQSSTNGNVTGSSLTKAKRKRISPQQYNRLMMVFEQTDTPSSEMRESLAYELDMTKREVQVWFQNRRAKASRAKAMATSAAYPEGYSSGHSMNYRPTVYAGIAPQHASRHVFVDHNNPSHHLLGSTHYDQPYASQPHILPRPTQQLHPIAPKLFRQSQSPYHTTVVNTGSPNGHVPQRVSAIHEHRRAGSLDQSPNGIHHGIANLSLRSADSTPFRQPARKRPKSAIDLLASAAEYVSADELGNRNHDVSAWKEM